MSQVRTYRKTNATRVHAALSVGVIVPLWIDLLLSPGAPLAARAILGILALLALLFTLSAFGDRYTLSDEALHFDNAVLSRARLSAGRRLALGEIASVREHRGRTLFIRDATGRRFVLDAVRGYVELRDQVLHAFQASKLRRDEPPAG